jgi:hypothetical protein
MFFPTPHDSRDAISKLAGFIGMVISIAIAVHLILPASGVLSASAKTIVCIAIGLMVGWLSFAVRLKK